MATLYRRGSSWYLNWSEGGQQFRRSLGTIEGREAERIRSAKEAELVHGVRILPRLPMVRDFLSWYLDWYRAEHPTTYGKAKSEFKAFTALFGHRPIDTIRPAEIETWKAERLKTHARETVGKEIRRLKAAFRRGMAWKEIDTNPIEHVSAPRGVRDVAVKFYTWDQVRELSEAPHGPLWVLMAHTGLRRAEATRVVQLEHVVAVGRRKRLRIESDPGETGAGRTKSGKRREVPLNSEALAALQRLPDRIAPVHPDTIGDWFSAEAGAVGGTVHRLRHTFCAHLAMAGVPLRRIQLLAGHGDYKTTERYAHLLPDGDDDAVDRLAEQHSNSTAAKPVKFK